MTKKSKRKARFAHTVLQRSHPLPPDAPPPRTGRLNPESTPLKTVPASAPTAARRILSSRGLKFRGTAAPSRKAPPGKAAAQAAGSRESIAPALPISTPYPAPFFDCPHNGPLFPSASVLPPVFLQPFQTMRRAADAASPGFPSRKNGFPPAFFSGRRRRFLPRSP